MTILIEKVEAPMAIKRTYSELGDAVADVLIAALPSGGVSETPPDPKQPVVVERRDPNTTLN